MPRKYPVGGESRLSIEGLRGKEVDGKIVDFVFPHGARRRTRTVMFRDGTWKDLGIYKLVGELIEKR